MKVIRCILVAGAAVVSVSAGRPENYPTEEEYKMLGLLNEMRRTGFECWGKTFPPNDVPLKWDCRLWRAAKGHSLDMANNDFFSHTGSDDSHPSDRARAQGTTFVGENLSSGYEDAETPLRRWGESGLGHCTLMMNPDARSIGAGYALNHLSSFWSYWTMLVSADLPDTPEAVDCLMDDGSLPKPFPTPMPSPPPTLETDTAIGHRFTDFEVSSWEYEVLHHLNEARRIGNRNECGGKFFKDLAPLDWNCGLFKAAREHMQDRWDHRATEKWGRTGINGETFAERAGKYGVPYSCSGFILKDNGEYWSSPEKIAQRIISLACWAVFEGTSVRSKSIGTAFARTHDADRGNFPEYAWILIFNNHETPENLKGACGSHEDPPVPPPTPAPVELPAPAALPTMPPTEPPTDRVTEPPTEPPTEPAAPTCSDYSEKKACKKTDNCTWKKSCKEKVKICSKQKNSKKCDKFKCTWDVDSESCDWTPVE